VCGFQELMIIMNDILKQDEKILKKTKTGPNLILNLENTQFFTFLRSYFQYLHMVRIFFSATCVLISNKLLYFHPNFGIFKQKAF
jgi:hypothetical protein